MELSRRNGASVEQALKQMTWKVEEQQQRIDGLVNSISTLMTRLTVVEQHFAADRIRRMGNGPTEVARGDHN